MRSVGTIFFKLWFICPVFQKGRYRKKIKDTNLANIQFSFMDLFLGVENRQKYDDSKEVIENGLCIKN